MSLLGWTPIQSDRCPYKKRTWGHTRRHQEHVCTQGNDPVRTKQEDKPRREVSEEIKPADTSILNLQASKIVRESISVVEVTPVCVILLWHPQQTNIGNLHISNTAKCIKNYGPGFPKTSRQALKGSKLRSHMLEKPHHGIVIAVIYGARKVSGTGHMFSKHDLT